MQLAGAQSPELCRDLARTDTRRVEHRAPADERHRGAAGSRGGAAAVGVEARVPDSVTLDHYRQLHVIAALKAADLGDVLTKVAVPLRRCQMVLESGAIHRSENRALGERVRHPLSDLEAVGKADDRAGLALVIDKHQRR